MENTAAGLRRSAYERTLYAFAVFLWCMGIACRQAAPDPTDQKIGMQHAVTSFRQVLTSSKADLKLHPGEDTRIPVRIQNPGPDTWMSAGRYPINVSYKWYKDGQMMSIEGERTALPSAIGPNQAIEAEVRVVAPREPGDYALRITLVQEAVAWFMINSHTFLALPVTVE